ncbi:MAG: hypothetical protein GXO47_13235, partial [Chlorobi bacterium]|nr:hypothetical protein [Chlorobiota bacterium]
MKYIYFLVIAFIFATLGVVSAQTGPGGIGNSEGSNGQPKNLIWVRADDLSLSDGDLVSVWPDSSGNGNDLVSSVNDTNDPEFYSNQINSLPIVRFSSASGTGTKLIRNHFDDFATDEITTIIIYKTSDSGDGMVSYAIPSFSNEFLLFNNSSLRTYIKDNSNYDSGVDLTSSSFQVVVHKWRSSDGELHLFQDGTDVANTTFKTGEIIETGGCLAIAGEQDNLDSGYDVTQAFDGDIAEIIIYSSYLNDAQRTIIENYINVKYGITISNDVFSSGDASYSYNVSGVGQEADGNQQESSSKGFYVVADAGTLDDGEYIMFAHNNTSNSVVTTDLPSGVEARWARDWYVEKTGGLDATIKFDLPEGIGGEYPQEISNYVLLYRNSTTGSYSQVTATVNYGDADQVAFDVLDADISNGYYTLGTTNETDSPLEGGPGRTWYTLTSGDWNDWEVWTLDPSGALPKNPDHEYPQIRTESVVVKNGKVVNMNVNDLHLSSVTVDGTLDLGTTTGHTFDNIAGIGMIKMAADNFPSYTDCSEFVDAGKDEGTVVFYGDADFTINSGYSFFNVEVDMVDTATNTLKTLTLLNDLQINGNLVVKNGTLKINDNSATTDLNITVNGDVSVKENGLIHTGSADARHQFNIYGDFHNEGEVKFTNRTSADYSNEATDGIVDVNFLNNSKDQ